MTIPPAPTADIAAQLLHVLESKGPGPVLAWYGEAARIELSGHVLANWLIKAIGHLHDDIALEPGELVVLDLPPHWKRLVLALAAWSLGAEVVTLSRDVVTEPPAADAVPEEPRVVATDRPGSPLAESADEVLALQAVSLAPRYDGELPALAHDWIGEVRGSSDRLGVALPGWNGPAPEPLPEGTPSQGARVLVEEDGLPSAKQVLAVLLDGGGIVGPAGAVTERQAQDEGTTGRLPRA